MFKIIKNNIFRYKITLIDIIKNLNEVHMAKKTNFQTTEGNAYFRTTLTVGYDEKGKQIQKVFYGASKKEAEDKKEKYKNEILNKSIIDTNAKLGEFMYRWLFDVVKNEVKHSSFNRYEGMYRNYIKDSALASMKLLDIRSIHIQKHYNTSFENLTYNSMSSINNFIKKFFNYCVREEYLIKNPCNNVSIPKNENKVENIIEIFTDEEISKIKNKCQTDVSYLFYLFALSTGLRVGELLALTYDDIDFNNLTVSVNKTLSHTTVISENSKERQILITTPKSDNSIRVVPFSKDLLPFFEKHIILEKEKAKTSGADQSNIVFSSKNLGYKCPKNINSSFRVALKNLDIPYRKFHTLRHTYCSILCKNNIPLKMAAELMGHDVEMTSKIYTHLDIKSKQDRVSNISFF